ncbi:zinc finger protein [Lentzea aerocolonigenes]|uniref:zinc finger protein n=1 Tax=Lentzea aerocolonigenes TaxID=68170 RepID=UPI0009DFB88C|nr:zinc finger protein [Lentzea aerocolonigenes]MCP2242490.1 zinc-finger [Lentzea aerocolonigenes]
MSRSYKWQPHDGARHALPSSLAEGDPGSTLCGIEVTTKSDKWPESERCWPMCGVCDLAWREEEQILPWPREGMQPVTESAQIKEVIAPLTSRSYEDALRGA